MNVRNTFLTLLCLLAYFTSEAFGQAGTQSPASFDFNNEGIVFRGQDTNNRVVMRFRMQNWATYTTKTQADDQDVDLSAGSSDFVTRRFRLRFGGTLFDPHLTFNFQMAFSRVDLDFADASFPNIIRDAMVYWNFSKTLQVGFGQAKLPGNRQAVLASADMEMGDRSIVNGSFSFDRDFGFQGFWRPIEGDVIVNLRGAITSGEGRNPKVTPGGGFAYTGRVEVLPLGAFTNGQDYIEGDLARENKPKLSIGLSASHNDSQSKTRGTLGTPLYGQRTADQIYVDGVFKYSGFSLYSEYAIRNADNPITYKDTTKSAYAAVYVGSGYMAQASYVFPSMFNVVARYARVQAGDQLKGLNEYAQTTNIAAALGYYVNRHRIKANLELGTNRILNLNTNILTRNYYARFNTEFGI